MGKIIGKSSVGIALSCLSFSLGGQFFQAEGAIASTPNPAVPEELPAEVNHSATTLTLSPLVPSCPFPPIPISDSVIEVIWAPLSWGEAANGNEHSTQQDSAAIDRNNTSTSPPFTPGDGSDDDLRQTADSLSRAGNLDEALETAQRIQSVSERDFALLYIATAYLDADQIEKALTATLLMSNPTRENDFPWRDSLLLRITETYIASGQLETALQVADNMSHNSQISTLITLTEKFQEANQVARAIEVLNRAVALQRSSMNRSEDSEPSALVSNLTDFFALNRFSKLYMALGQTDQAVALADQIFQISHTFPQSEYLTLSVLGESIEVYLQAGATDKAVAALSEVLQATETLEEPFAKAVLLSGSAQFYNTLAQPDRATALLAQAQTLLNSEDDVDQRNFGLTAIAVSYAVLGQYNNALQASSTMEPASLRAQFQQTLICLRQELETGN